VCHSVLDCYTQALASNAPLDPTIMLRCSLLLACVAAMAPASTKKRPPKDDPRQRKTPGLFDSVERPGIDLRQKPEVMAPAGGWPQLRAAVNNGADAVYFGLSTFSARARAANFDPGDELDQVIAFLRANEVKGYVALNTLAFDEELAEVEKLLRRCSEAGVDAIIVQDMGIMALARDVAPELPIHASTQQSISSADGAEFARERGATRVVVGRELSTSEIASVARGTFTEVEAFVHGALCISWSGQCLSSEAWGGRSANRGQCAQACRLPYGVVIDGVQRQGLQYALSPGDLCGLDDVAELIEAGVSCFKIEGRLKDERYVAATTRSYREAIDAVWDRHDASAVAEDTATVSRNDLRQVFARGQDADVDGLTPGFLRGPKHQSLVVGNAPRHRGVLAGRVLQVTAPCKTKGLELLVEPSKAVDLKRGDGVVIDCGPDNAKEEVGGSLYDVAVQANGYVRITFGRDVAGKPWLKEGALLWRTADTLVDAKLKKLASASNVKRTAVDVAVAIVASRLELTLSDGRHTVMETTPVAPATDKPLTTDTVVKAIGIMGDTPWTLGTVAVDLDGDWWCGGKDIKQARRAAVEQLKKLRAPVNRTAPTVFGAARARRNLAGADGGLEDADLLLVKADTDPRVSVLVRDPAQCRAVCGFQGHLVDEIVLDYLELDNLEASLQMVREAELRAVIAAPRITMPGELVLDGLVALKPDALLARSPGQLRALDEKGVEIRGDFSLNAANSISFAEYADEGLARLTPAHDLSGAAIAELAKALSPERRNKLEPVLHQHLPIFHSSHCLYARYLSKGDSYANCGHVCETHKLHLKDEQGQDHLVLADMGCRNTIFNAQAQSGADALSQWLAEGIARYRVEFVDESPEGVTNVLGAYAALFAASGEAPEPLWSLLSGVLDSNDVAQGAGPGSLRVDSERKSGKAAKTTGQRRSKVAVHTFPEKSTANSRKKKRRLAHADLFGAPPQKKVKAR